MGFILGMKEQTVEIGGVELLNYGTSRKVADLPFTRIGYQGSEPTAAWRKAAEARIEKVRKGDLTVLVKDGAGKPVSGAQVAVRMKKHAFLWGTAVNASAFSNGRMTPENLERYKQEILKNFNVSVMENENKWPQWSNVANRPATIKVIDWLRDNGVQGPRPQSGLALLEQLEREGGAGGQGQSSSTGQGDPRPHLRNDQGVEREVRRLGCDQRDVHQPRLHGHPRPPSDGRLVQGGARRRPGCQALHQRLQHHRGRGHGHTRTTMRPPSSTCSTRALR